MGLPEKGEQLMNEPQLTKTDRADDYIREAVDDSIMSGEPSHIEAADFDRVFKIITEHSGAAPRPDDEQPGEITFIGDFYAVIVSRP